MRDPTLARNYADALVSVPGEDVGAGNPASPAGGSRSRIRAAP